MLFAFCVSFLQKGYRDYRLQTGFRWKLQVTCVTISRMSSSTAGHNNWHALIWGLSPFFFSFLTCSCSENPSNWLGMARMLHLNIVFLSFLYSPIYPLPALLPSPLPVLSPCCSLCLSPTCLWASVNAPLYAGNSVSVVCQAPSHCLPSTPS